MKPKKSKQAEKLKTECSKCKNVFEENLNIIDGNWICKKCEEERK